MLTANVEHRLINGPWFRRILFTLQNVCSHPLGWNIVDLKNQGNCNNPVDKYPRGDDVYFVDSLRPVCTPPSPFFPYTLPCHTMHSAIRLSSSIVRLNFCLSYYVPNIWHIHCLALTHCCCLFFVSFLSFIPKAPPSRLCWPPQRRLWQFSREFVILSPASA